MKLQLKALSLTLGLVALLGACTSVKSGTPDISGAENSVEISPDGIELGDVEEFGSEELEVVDEMDGEELEASEEFETEELEASDEIEDVE
ncbi:MAG: hypothetical protein AAFO95_09165, partial [Cyanobacteria bacterium J06600_6]